MAGKNRPSRKNRSVKSNINRVKRNIGRIEGEMTGISSKTRNWEQGSDPHDVDKVPITKEQAAIRGLATRMGLEAGDNWLDAGEAQLARTRASFRGKTKGRTQRAILGSIPKSKGKLPTKGLAYKGTLNLTNKSNQTARRIPKNARMLSEEEGFKAYSVNNAWVTFQMETSEGRWVVGTVRRGVWNKGVDIYNERASKGMGGHRNTPSMKNAFKTAWYDNDPVGGLLKEMHACEGLYKILRANNSDGEWSEEMRMIQDAIRTGDFSIMRSVREYITKDWDSMIWDEMLAYKDTYSDDAFSQALEEDFA